MPVNKILSPCRLPKKYFQLLLPTLAGLVVVILLLQLRQSVLTLLYPAQDAPFTIDPLFDAFSLLPLYLVILVAAILLQLCILPWVWKMHRERGKVIGFRLWEITGLACFVFGLAIGIFNWNSQAGFLTLAIQVIIWLGLASSYWTVNFIILNLIDKTDSVEKLS